MSSSTCEAQLAALTKELFERWRQTRESWRDDKAREFAERYLGELESAVSAALGAARNLESTIRRIRSDCE